MNNGLNTKTITIDGSTQSVVFDEKAPYFLVKNLSDEDITVSFSSAATETNITTIGSGMAQLIFANIKEYDDLSEIFSTVYVTGTDTSGKVEVLPLWKI